eukprot:scaffold220330_cov42-Prasinocladus_malaysianus.AAC.1
MSVAVRTVCPWPPPMSSSCPIDIFRQNQQQLALRDLTLQDSPEWGPEHVPRECRQRVCKLMMSACRPGQGRKGL